MIYAIMPLRMFLLPAGRVVSYRTKSKGRWRWRRRWQRSSSNNSNSNSNSNNSNNSSSRRRKRLCRDLFVVFLFLSKKKKSIIDTVWSIYYIVNQVNDINLMWDEIGHGVRPATLRRCKVMAFSGIELLQLLLHDRCYSYRYSYSYSHSHEQRSIQRTET